MKHSAEIAGSTLPEIFCSQTEGNESFLENSLRKAVKERSSLSIRRWKWHSWRNSTTPGECVTGVGQIKSESLSRRGLSFSYGRIAKKSVVVNFATAQKKENRRMVQIQSMLFTRERTLPFRIIIEFPVQNLHALGVAVNLVPLLTRHFRDDTQFLKPC